MPREDRKAVGAPTNQELEAKLAKGQERLLHDQFERWCRINEVVYIHSRMDRKSTIAAGHPDFTLLWKGRGCCVEFKALGGILSDDQKEALHKLAAARVPMLISSDVKQAIAWTKENLLMDL
jgi:hypothetical protein